MPPTLEFLFFQISSVCALH